MTYLCNQCGEDINEPLKREFQPCVKCRAIDRIMVLEDYIRQLGLPIPSYK